MSNVRVLCGCFSYGAPVSHWACGNGRTQLLASGTCGCQGYDLTQGDDYKIILDLLPYAEHFIGSQSEDIQRRVVELICAGVLNYGDQELVSGGWCTHVVRARCLTSFDQQLSRPYIAGTEVALSWTRKTLLVSSTKHREVLDASNKG